MEEQKVLQANLAKFKAMTIQGKSFVPKSLSDSSKPWNLHEFLQSSSQQPKVSNGNKSGGYKGSGKPKKYRDKP